MKRSSRTVLDKAKALVHGDRNASYGHPIEDFSRTAEMLNGLFRDKLIPGDGFAPADIPKIMICVKLSRTMAARRQDNWTDIAGYAETGDWVEETLEDRP